MENLKKYVNKGFILDIWGINFLQQHNQVYTGYLMGHERRENLFHELESQNTTILKGSKS